MGDANSRRFTRIVIKLPITLVPLLDTVSCVGGVEDAVIRDLSLSGALVTVTLRHEIYDAIAAEKCECYIKFGGNPMLPKKLVARTVWVQSMIGTKETMSCRMGLHFGECPEADRGKLNAFLAKAAAEQGIILSHQQQPSTPRITGSELST